MRILIIEPYFSGSHAAWAEGYARHSRHRVEILSLPGRHWKWRMQGAAPELAARYRERVAAGKEYDLLLASDMLDLAAFLGLLGPAPRPPVALYFHENQLAYPRSPGPGHSAEKEGFARERWFGFINFTSALAADRCFFNSSYHRESFFTALAGLLQRFPDFRLEESTAKLRNRSEVLYLGLGLKALDKAKPELRPASSQPPLILWNHRWDYDKNPEGFCLLLLELLDAGADFNLVLIGAESGWRPESFARLTERLGRRLLHSGFAADFSEYASWLWRADILPVTSHQDFFGISVVEAIHCGCYPLLPDRLAYPEHIPAPLRTKFIYPSRRELKQRLLELLTLPPAELQQQARAIPVAHYDWSRQAPLYDRRFCELVENPAGAGKRRAPDAAG